MTSPVTLDGVRHVRDQFRVLVRREAADDRVDLAVLRDERDGLALLRASRAVQSAWAVPLFLASFGEAVLIDEHARDRHRRRRTPERREPR